jgi:hypothetical protein
VEGFSTPWSTKRTAIRPSPHTISLWICCSTSPGSLSLWLHQAPAPCGTAQINTPPGSPLHWHHDPQTMLGFSSMWDHQMTTLPGSPPLRPSWAPAPHGTDRYMPHWDPSPSGLLGPSSVWDSWSHVLLGPCPLGSHHAPALQACQIPAPPGPHLADHLRRASNPPKRHRQTGLDAKGLTSEQLRL